MRLIELELTNIKSYKHEIIKFSEGINCILGLNGSGKSTIIESIGSVLFNYNQRTTNSLIRYNEGKGQISLLFEGNDNKIYRIVKNLRNKGASSIKLIDEETAEVLQETVSDVYELVKRILNIPKEKGLAKMYEEIIAVPQGTFVNAFLETPKNRKENFDKLFELDIYKKLSDELKLLSDKVQKEYIFKVEKEIASIDGKLTDYESKKENKSKIEKEVEKLKNDYSDISDIYNKKTNKKNQLELLYNELEASINSKSTIDNNISNVSEQIKIYKENLNISKEAKKLLLDNELGYNLYVKNNNELKNNEKTYINYLDLTSKINDNNLEISKLKESNKYINEHIHNQKIQLGQLKEQNINKDKSIKENNNQISQLEKDIVPIKQHIYTKEQNKTEVQAKYTFYLDKLNNVNNYLLSFSFKDNIEENKQTIKEIEEQLQKIVENKEKIISLDIQKVKIVSDLENLNTNNSYINDGLCPILKQKCLNISGSSLSNEVERMIKNKEVELSKINSNINVLLQENNKEESLIKQKEVLLLENNNTLRQKDKYSSVIEDLEKTFSCENLHISLDNDKEIVGELIKKYEKLKNNYDDVELINLKNEELKCTNLIYSLKSQNNINQNIINENNNKISETANDITNKNKEYNSNLSKISEYEKENDHINTQILQIGDIKQKIDDNKKIIEKYVNNYNIYISKQNEASNYDKYQQLVKDNEETLERYQNELNNIILTIKELSEKVSKESLATLTNEVNELNSKLAVLNNTIDISNNQLNNLKKDLEILDNYILERNQKQKELDKYNDLDNKYKLYRVIFNNLPKELSKQIRKYISIYASNLYRKISNENVRIDILDDYEVILVDCIEQTKQKSLSQLSGGEQMSVAIAIRLAMLKQITNVSFYFMDEPTINLDYERRMMVGEVVKDISQELRQLFVISHDDTFESITDNNIKIIKNNNESMLEE